MPVASAPNCGRILSAARSVIGDAWSVCDQSKRCLAAGLAPRVALRDSGTSSSLTSQVSHGAPHPGSTELTEVRPLSQFYKLTAGSSGERGAVGFARDERRTRDCEATGNAGDALVSVYDVSGEQSPSFRRESLSSIFLPSPLAGEGLGVRGRRDLMETTVDSRE